MRRAPVLAAAAAAVSLLAACGGDQPVPERGTVTDARYTPAWMQWMPGTTSCSGNPPSCISTPGYPIFWPEEWRLEVTDLSNPEWVGTVEVDEDVYERCNLRELWPECSYEDSGVVYAGDQ
ncbi:hypothetical protein PBI_THONKO_53 [Mycobacterium phage Thonko]|uniref:Lipoprotein n=1 Tax=Mycobacterium phage Thonko TaxID=2282910 RepID=A0A346FCA0_9CAUD|nr:hypothetical protein I5G57_gp053 [Mycobacterium phage Thonko]AXN53325.1 hypothetical protein PBI_THONKO_53 [Mycobacterium phage Thonko]